MECMGLKSCWCLFCGICVLIYGRMAFSRTLAMGDRSEIGRCEVPRLGSLLGLGMGMIFASFQECGMVLVCIARL